MFITFTAGYFEWCLHFVAVGHINGVRGGLTIGVGWLPTLAPPMALHSSFKPKWSSLPQANSTLLARVAIILLF